MGSTRQALINDTSVVAMLYMALELSSSKWLVAISDGERAASQHTLRGGDVGALLQLIEKAKKLLNVASPSKEVDPAGKEKFFEHSLEHMHDHHERHCDDTGSSEFAL